MIIFVIFCLIFLLIISFLRKKRINYFIIITFSTITIYTTLVLLNYNDRVLLEKKIKKYDINKDGLFTKNEDNEELRNLENELISDTDENLFIIFGLPICLIFTAGNVMIYQTLNFTHNKLQKLNKKIL